MSPIKKSLLALIIASLAFTPVVWAQPPDVLIDSRTSPVQNGVPVTFSDVTPFLMTCPSAEGVQRANRYCRGFMAMSAGDVSVVFPSNPTPVTLTVAAGAYYPIIVSLFRATGTDAGLKVAGQIIAFR